MNGPRAQEELTAEYALTDEEYTRLLRILETQASPGWNDVLAEVQAIRERELQVSLHGDTVEQRELARLKYNLVEEILDRLKDLREQGLKEAERRRRAARDRADGKPQAPPPDAGLDDMFN